jgi:hypothetical protein
MRWDEGLLPIKSRRLDCPQQELLPMRYLDPKIVRDTQS